MQETNWHEIYSKLSPKLLGVCRRYIKDIATAEDIVQDAFIVAIQKEQELKNKDALNGWLRKIVVHRAINYLKNEQKINFTSTTNFECADETNEINIMELDKKSVLLASDFSHKELLEAIDSLSENHKSVFNLYIIDGFSHLEISKLLSISVGTSKSSLSRARKNIQEFLFEKLSLHSKEKKKKRIIAFLLFLGFGNQLFANYYKKAFSNFEISPKNTFNPDKKCNNLDLILLNTSIYRTKILKLITLFTGLVSLIVLFFYNNATPKIIQETKKNTIINTIDKKDTISLSNEVKTSEKKRAIIEVKTPALHINSVEKKDSATNSEVPKIVVIKKQIIKKDTVYVEKE
ncbi:MAG: RNA polymerase sigma factor [Flavobacterium sp.]|jgi:RNA polymerase sigma factor (sigma-70 family)|uniref:RNA polymerase sigma factor n=1 Tax=Flavobacterium sp. TaxID=239 RepID=UPI002B4A0B93|nr:RNA polymerase sigma factor [Flavobacterium sp.]WRH72418.1 MAG: RNA polymerase sigma factor [Flavobacterium sp.]